MERSVGFIFTSLSCLIQFLHSVSSSCVRILHKQVVRVLLSPGIKRREDTAVGCPFPLSSLCSTCPQGRSVIRSITFRGLAVATSDRTRAVVRPSTAFHLLYPETSGELDLQSYSRPGLYYDITHPSYILL